MTQQATVSDPGTIPPEQFATGNVDQVLEIKLEGLDAVPNTGPGSMVMEVYDSAYLKVINCGWYPANELVPFKPTFVVNFLPLKSGHTDVRFQVRPRSSMPVYESVTVHVTINN